MNLEFLRLELYSVTEHILACLPGEGLSLFYEPDERSKGIFCNWKVGLWQKHLLIKYPYGPLHFPASFTVRLKLFDQFWPPKGYKQNWHESLAGWDSLEHRASSKSLFFPLMTPLEAMCWDSRSTKLSEPGSLSHWLGKNLGCPSPGFAVLSYWDYRVYLLLQHGLAYPS